MNINMNALKAIIDRAIDALMAHCDDMSLTAVCALVVDLVDNDDPISLSLAGIIDNVMSVFNEGGVDYDIEARMIESRTAYRNR